MPLLRSAFAIASTNLFRPRQSIFPLTNIHTSLSHLHTMTTESTTNNITSPPTSPPAKRVKTDESTNTMTTDSTSTSAPAPAPAAATSNGTVPITKVDQATPLLIKKLSDKARLPTRGSSFAAGYDLYAAHATTIPARGKAIVETDISMAVPAGTCTFSPFPLPPLQHPTSLNPRNADEDVTKTDGRIAPRSGLAAKNFIDTGAGVIDADYRGPVKVLLFNHSDADFAVNEGDRVAQLVLERIYTPEVLEVAELDESVRGAGGFGSTGVN